MQVNGVFILLSILLLILLIGLLRPYGLHAYMKRYDSDDSQVAAKLQRFGSFRRKALYKYGLLLLLLLFYYYYFIIIILLCTCKCVLHQKRLGLGSSQGFPTWELRDLKKVKKEIEENIFQ